MALVPQVVDAVSPIPVVASGSIFDGRGIAAALMLGAAGVNLGTRFIASTEAPAPNEWKEAITAAQSEDAIKVEVLNDISPLPGTAGFGTVLRSLHTAFLDEWSAKREEARRERDRLRGQIVSTTQAGRQHECLLTAGQTVGGINEILSVGEIMRRLMARPKPRWRGRRAWARHFAAGKNRRGKNISSRRIPRCSWLPGSRHDVEGDRAPCRVVYSSSLILWKQEFSPKQACSDCRKPSESRPSNGVCGKPLWRRKICARSTAGLPPASSALAISAAASAKRFRCTKTNARCVRYLASRSPPMA